MKKCDIRFKVENDLTTIGAVDESNNIQDITAVTEYKNQFDKEARFFYNYKKEVFAFDGYQLKFNESNLKEFNKIQKNENNYYRTRLGDNLVTVRENLEVFVEQGLNSVENFNFKDKENKLFDKGIPFENISIEQRQALSKQNIIYPANIINKTDLPIEIKNYVNLYNQYISLNSSNRANFATNRSVINENTVLYLDSANKLNYIMAASDLASLEESEVHGNNYLSIALAQRGEQEDVNISESVSDNPVYAKRIKELKTELKELVDKRGRVLPGKERQYNNAKKHLAFLEQSVYDQMRSAIILFLQENKIKVNYSLANSLYEIAIKSDTTADFHEEMQDRFYSDIKLPFAFSYFDSWGMSISELMKKEYNRINTESKKFDGKDGIYIEREHRAKDFNNYIRKNGDRQTKYIWKLIKNVAFKINPKIKFVFEENFRGTNYAEAFTQDQTNFKSTKIEIRASLLQNPKQAAATLVHEIIHSIAHNIIDIVVFNEKKQIHLLTERQINAVKELIKLIKEVQANDKTNKFYGATDAHELLSELTNKEFVEALKEKAPNIFRRIQNFFLNILGIEKNKYRRAEAILKDIISKPVHITEIGNTIYPGLFPQKTFYKNDFLESVADSNLKLPIDLGSKQDVEGFKEFVEDKTSALIKPGVSELFESTPELANAVYEVLGFSTSELTMESFMPKKHWKIGHIIDSPAEAANICGNTQIMVLNYALDKFGKTKERGTFYAKPVAIWAKSPINDKQILHYTVAVRINNKVYLYDMPQSEYIEYISENKGKVIKEYNPRLIEYTHDNLKKYYGTSDENLTIQDETILTDALLNVNVLLSQQKQQAQQLYSQYLDSIFPNSKVKDIVYHGTDNKFEKYLKEKIGSKESGNFSYGFNFIGTKHHAKQYSQYSNSDIVLEQIINVRNPFIITPNKASSYIDVESLDLKDKQLLISIGLNLDKFETVYDAIKDFGVIKFTKELKELGYDGFIRINNYSSPINAHEYVVFEPEQIHILSSKKDIEGFKEFVQGKPTFDVELAQKIQDKLQKLYPEIKLNITNNPIWEQGGNIFNQKQALENEVAYRLKVVNSLINLTIPKGDKRYSVGDKPEVLTIRLNSKKQPYIETNLRKRLNGKGVTNQQIDFIFDYMKSNNIQEISTEQLALELASKYGFSIEIDTAKKNHADEGEDSIEHISLNVPGGINYKINVFKTPLIIPSIINHFFHKNQIGWFRSDEQAVSNGKIIYVTQGTGKSTLVKNEPEKYTDGDDLVFNYLKEKGIASNTTTSQNAGNELKQYLDTLTEEEKSKVIEELISIFNKEKSKGKIVLTSNRFTRENPDILDEIYLSEDAGRMEQEFIKRGGNPANAKKVVEQKLKEQQEAFKNKQTKTIGKGEYISDKFKTPTKTRRILELQSDLFQRGRNFAKLLTEEYIGKEYVTNEDLIKKLDSEVNPMYTAEDSQMDPVYINNIAYSFDNKGWYSKKYSNVSKENQFLQLLNKDNNWVTFFIKSIIQDSAKKGYEKVLFPKGETAAKIEGHETIADEIRKIDKEIKNNKEFLNNPTNLYEVTPFDDNYTDAILEDGLENKIKKAEKNIAKLEKEKEELKSQGIEKLKPIEAFYEIVVGNILEKLFGKDNIKTITDEYANQWREITINQARDLSDILLQRNETNQIIGQANIKAMTVLINAVNQKQDTLPHEYAHHYIAWYRDTPIVQEAIKKWGSEEALVQSIGEQVVKQKGEAYNWWNNFVKWIMNQFNSLSKLQKEELTQILTDAFLTRQDLGSKQDIEGFKEFVQKDNVNTQEGLNLTKSITVDETTNTVNINDILVNGTTTIKATSEFTIEGISDSNIETLIIEAPSVNVNTENFNVETLIIKTESQTSFPDINISQNSNIKSLQIQNSNTNLEITDLTSENNLVFKNFVFADKNDCFLDNFTETSGFTINSAEPFKYSLNFDNSKNLTILQTNELKEIPVSIRNIENLTLEEDVEINIVSMQTTALNLNVNENNIIRLEKKYEKAAINIQAEEPTNITLHGKTRVNLDFKDKFVSINNNVSLTKDSDISFQEEAWSETEKFQEQQEKVLEKQYDSVEEYIDNDDPFDLKTSIDSYISEFNSINPELKKTAKIVQVEADSHAIYRENHTTTLTISESVADILEDRSPYIKVSEEEATNALMSSLNPASFLTVNEQLLATSVLDIDIDHLANKIISGLIYINVNSVGMNVRTLFDNLTHLKEQFKDEKVVLENLKKLDSKLNEKYAELKVRIQKDSVTYSERVHKALEDTVLDENEETQQKRVLELSRKKLNAFYTEQINTLYKQLKEVTKQIELLLQEDTSAEFRVPAALKIKLQEKITDLKDQRLRVRNLRAEDIVSEFTVSLSNLTPLLDSYTEFIKFLEDNKEEINSVTLTHTIDKTIQDLVIALGQEQSKMETAKLLAFKDGKKVPETALDAYTSEMLKSLAGRVQLLSTRTSALARQSFFKYAAEVLNVDVADIAREIKALQDNGLPDTHILDEWFFDPTKGLFMPDKAGLFPSLMQMTLDSEINAWRSYAIRLSTDLNNVKEEGDKALKKIRINGRKMNALDFKARNKYGRYTKHFIDVYNEDYIQNYKAVWRTLNELLKFKLDTPEKKNKSLKPFIDQIANQYEAVNIFKLSAFADLKGKRLPVYMDIDFQVDAEYEQSLKDKYGEEVFNYLVEQSKEKFLNKIQNWEYDFKSVAVANNAESFAELQAKNPEAANTLLEKLKDRLPLPSDFKDTSYVAKTKLFVNSFTVPTSTKVFNKFFIDNVLGNETIRKYYTALKNLENYIINQKNELDNVSYAAPLVKYKTFLEYFTDNRENHSFLMKTSAAFRSLFKDVNKLWFKTYKAPGEVTGIATQESLSIIPKAVPSNFYKNQMAIKKIAEAANSAVLTKKIPATSDSFVHFIFEKVANLPFVKGVTTVEDLMTEFNEIRANYVRISDALNAVINSLLTHLEYEKSSTDLAETLKAHLLIINMATSRNMAQGKINILLKYFQDIKKTIKQKGTTTVSDRVRAKALSAVQTWYDKNIIGANLEADPDSAGKLRLGKEDRELLEYLRKEGILTEKESKEIQPFFTYKKLSAGAIITAFLKYTIWKGLGWSMKSSITNFMQGMLDDFIAGASGKYYTADYYYKALRMLPQSMFKFFTFSYKLVPKALRGNLENSDAVKFRRLMDKFKVLQDSSNLLQQAGKNEKFLNTQKLDAFHWQKSIEYLNQGVLILGEIYSRDIQIDENTKVKLWDLFDQQGNLKEEYASNKELYINWQLGRGKQFNAFTSKVNKMIVEVHGDYQETRGFKASHSEVGRALILFKKFFPQQVANRWSKKQTVYELGEDTMGRTEDSLDKMQTIGRYRALTPSAAALVGAANIRTSLSAALLRPIFGSRLKPLLSIADAVISPWLLPATAIGAVVGATWAIAAKLYNGKQKGAKIFGDMPQVLGRTLYGFITTPVNVLAGRELLKNTYSNKSLSALENLAMNESLNDVRIALFMTMLSMLIRWKLHRDPNDDGSDDEESTTDQVLLATLNRIDVNLAEHTQYTDPLSVLQFLDLTESSPANTLAQMINMPIKVQKQMERIEKMTEIEKHFLTDSDYDRASYWVGFKETFLPSPARKYWGWSSSMNFDFTTEIKTRETKQFVPALYHPIEWLTTTKEQREEKEMEARILNIKNAYKKEFKNLYFDYFQSLDESEKKEFADELKKIINKAMAKPKYLDDEQTLSFFENESMLRAKVNLSIKKFYFTDRFKQQQVKIKNNKEAQAAYNAVIKLFEKQKNDDLYKINGGTILNYSTKYKIYKKEIINKERELKEALNRAGINYIAPKAVEKVVI